MNISKQKIGTTPEGVEVIEYRMENSRGESVSLMNYGATILSICVADSKGQIDDVALGYKEWQSYMGDGPAMGKSVGRFANRIARGHFSIDGKEYSLAINNDVNALHGGPSGFMNRVWESSVEGESVVFSYFSQDGEEGYPADLKVEARYEWDDDANLKLTYSATTEAKTIVNLTNHVYFNLDGHDAGSIREHTLQLNCQEWLPTDQTKIPTGEAAAVEGTPMDFTTPHKIGERIDDDFEALKIGKGYDHCWLIKRERVPQDVREVGELASQKSGRKMKISTSQVGVQIYTGNWLKGSATNKSGGEYNDNDGVAIECQALPDSPTKPQFPSTILERGERYEEVIIYSFYC